MAMQIDDQELEEIAREIANRTGESVNQAVLQALRKRKARLDEPEVSRQGVAQILREARTRLAKLPVLDNRSADEILGYDRHGLPL